MALNQDQIDFLQGIDENCIHGRNILAKKGKKHIEDFYPYYKLFYSKTESEKVEEKIAAFIHYKNIVSKKNKKEGGGTLFSSQSKFESTVLEEFLFHLFKGFADDNYNIKTGKIKAYVNLYFSAKNFSSFKEKNYVKINKKDQDFAIYKKVILTDKEDKYKLYVPVVAIECKTYLDKTMLEGSIATAEKIKAGNPHCKFFIVTETYQVKYDVDPFTSRIDNIFVLRKGGETAKNKDIQEDVIKNLYKEVETHLSSNWSTIEENIGKNGTVF